MPSFTSLMAHFCAQNPTTNPHTRKHILTVGALEMQGLGPLCCLVLEKSVEVGILGNESYTEGLDKTHMELLPLAFDQSGTCSA